MDIANPSGSELCNLYEVTAEAGTYSSGAPAAEKRVPACARTREWDAQAVADLARTSDRIAVG